MLFYIRNKKQKKVKTRFNVSKSCNFASENEQNVIYFVKSRVLRK